MSSGIVSSRSLSSAATSKGARSFLPAARRAGLFVILGKSQPAKSKSQPAHTKVSRSIAGQKS